MKVTTRPKNYSRLKVNDDGDEEGDIHNLKKPTQSRLLPGFAVYFCCALLFFSSAAALDYLRRRSPAPHAVSGAPATAPTLRPMESLTLPGVSSGDDDAVLTNASPTPRPTSPPVSSPTALNEPPTAAPAPRPTPPPVPPPTPPDEPPTAAPAPRSTPPPEPSPTPLEELPTTPRPAALPMSSPTPPVELPTAAPTSRPSTIPTASPTPFEVSSDDACPEMLVEIQVENIFTRSMGVIGREYPWLGRNPSRCEVDDTPLIAMDVSMAMNISANSRRSVFGCSYEWHRDGAPIGGRDHPLSGVKIDERGAIVVFSVLETGCMDSSSKSVVEDAHASVRVIALTVRREIREYPLEEISRMMDAMYPMWAMTTSMGIERYGPNFRSVDDIDELHRRNAGAYDSDHFHEGMGFLTQHTKLSMYFEKSMRQIDPGVALPYWDATIDMALKASGTIESSWDTIIFSELMFGSTGNTRLADDVSTTQFDEGGDATWRQFAIPDGRWAFLRNHLYTDLNKSKSTPHNMYGRLRSPWNTNRSPYLTRFRNGATERRFADLPVCEVHARFSGCNERHDDFSVLIDASLPEPYFPNCRNQDWWMRNVELIPHAKYHSFIAGELLTPRAYNALSISYAGQASNTASDHKLRKMLWRCARYPNHALRQRMGRARYTTVFASPVPATGPIPILCPPPVGADGAPRARYNGQDPRDRVP